MTSHRKNRPNSRSPSSKVLTTAAEPSSVAAAPQFHASGVTPRDGAGSTKRSVTAKRATKPTDGPTKATATKSPTGTVEPLRDESPPAISAVFPAGSRGAVPHSALTPEPVDVTVTKAPTTDPVDDERPPEISSLLPTGSRVAVPPSALTPKPIDVEVLTTTEKNEQDMAPVNQPDVGSQSRSVARGTTPAVSPQPAEREAFVVEPEEHVDADVAEWMLRKFKGTRPDLFRTSAYYASAKNVYTALAGLPILKSIAPTVESITESVINMTPLKPSSEEQAQQKSVAVLDKKICEALMYADEVVDTKKDETIEGVVSVKKTISSLGPVETAVGLACNVGDGVGKAYTSANDTVGKTWQQAFNAAWSTYVCATTTAGDAVNHVTSTAGDAVNHVTSTAGRAVSQVNTTAGNAINSVKCTADSTVGGLKSAVGNTANSITSTYNWATSTAMSFINAAIAIPVGFVQFVVGTKEKEPSPEE